MKIGTNPISEDHPVYIIAEMSANHAQNFDQAVKTIQAAKSAGANAIKLQTYTAATLTLPCKTNPFKISGGTLWDGRTMYDLYQDAHTPWEWQPKLKKIANDLGMDCFSSPFDKTSVDFLETMDVPAYKIASFEIVDLGLIAHVARTKKPIIFSTGMASKDEIREAIQTATAAGATEIALLKCTSAYPALISDANLKTISDMRNEFQVPIGVSDHTLGILVPVAAAALDACIIEKHFTLSRAQGGPDSAFSLEPSEFAEMVKNVRSAQLALGEIDYGVTGEQTRSLKFRRSLFVVRPVKAGELFTEDNIRSIRPSDGLSPKFLSHVIGRKATQDISLGTPLSWDLIEEEQTLKEVSGNN